MGKGYNHVFIGVSAGTISFCPGAHFHWDSDWKFSILWLVLKQEARGYLSMGYMKTD